MERFLIKSALCLTIVAASTLSAFAQENDSNAKKSLLPQLAQIARDEGGKVFSICEICDGVSKTEVIRENIRCHNTYSIAKLFTVATLGVLSDKGILDVDEPVYPIFKDRFPEGFDSKWRDVKISDVIRHRTGYGPGCNILDIDATDSSKWDRDFLSIALGQPLAFKPGSTFYYTDATFYVASRIVDAKTSEPLNKVMIRELLEPMGFAEYAFSTDPEGFPMGATGMYVSVEDMAKLGLLFVQDGVYNGRRLLSKEFVDEAFERTFELYPLDDEGAAFVKGGMNGQLLYMNRKTKRVVAIFSYLSDTEQFQKFLIENDR